MRCHLCTACSTFSFRAIITKWRVLNNLNKNNKHECTLIKCRRKLLSLSSLKRHFKLDLSLYFSAKVNPGSFSGIGAANNCNFLKMSVSENTNNYSFKCFFRNFFKIWSLIFTQGVVNGLLKKWWWNCGQDSTRTFLFQLSLNSQVTNC